MRPHTLLADVSHEITPAMRSHIELKIEAEEAKKANYLNYGNSFIIPFGDMYKAEAVGSAVFEASEAGSSDVGVDYNQVLRDAAATPEGFMLQVCKCIYLGGEPLE